MASATTFSRIDATIRPASLIPISAGSDMEDAGGRQDLGPDRDDDRLL
jgi:hypothetical protein